MKKSNKKNIFDILNINISMFDIDSFLKDNFIEDYDPIDHDFLCMPGPSGPTDLADDEDIEE